VLFQLSLGEKVKSVEKGEIGLNQI